MTASAGQEGGAETRRSSRERGTCPPDASLHSRGSQVQGRGGNASMGGSAAAGTTLGWMEVMAADCWLSEEELQEVKDEEEEDEEEQLWLELQEDLLLEGFVPSLFGSRTQIRSPDTMSQEDKVVPATESSSEPFRDKLKALSDLSPCAESSVSLIRSERSFRLGSSPDNSTRLV